MNFICAAAHGQVCVLLFDTQTTIWLEARMWGEKTEKKITVFEVT